MELIDGKDLTSHARDHTLSVRQRLELMVEVCDAVQHAHQNGIIHRDLKPANILVESTTGQPRILDFGVAHISDADGRTTLHTTEGQLLGTLAYMSPEQVTGDQNAIDVRCDVYALGLVTFELLTGQRPYSVTGKAIPEALRIISSAEPLRLGAVDRHLRGDLETIVSKCLDKAPDRRYPSVAGLAEDLRRYLGHEPILARPPTTIYQLGKLARRHAGLTAAMVTTLLVLVAGVVGTTTQAVRASRALGSVEVQRTRAERSAAAASQVSEFLIGLFRANDPLEPNSATISARELLDRGALEVQMSLPDQPTIRATIMQTIGRAYLNLGQYDAAATALEAALGVARPGSAFPATEAATLVPLGWVRLRQGREAEAESIFREALALTRRPEADPGATAAALDGLGAAIMHQQRFEEAETLLEEALAIRRELGIPRDEIATMVTMSGLRTLQGDSVGAEGIIRAALERRLQAGGEAGGIEMPILIGHLANAMARNTNPERAAALYRRALAAFESVVGGAHPDVAWIHGGLSQALASIGAFVEAAEHAEAALAISREVFGDEHARTAGALEQRGWIAYRQADYPAAERDFQEALRIRLAVLDPRHPDVGSSHNDLGAVAVDRGDLPAAREHFELALSILSAALGEHHPKVGAISGNLVAVLGQQGLFELAEPHSARAVEIALAMYGEDHPELADALDKRAWVLHKLGRHDEAVQLYDRSLDVRRRHQGAANPLFAVTLIGRGSLLTDMNRLDQAESDLRTALQVVDDVLSPEHFLHDCAAGALGACLTAQKRFDEAEPLLLGSYEHLIELRGAGSSLATEAVDRLAALYEAWDRPDDAASYRR